jgi:hypothetical protein
MFVFILFHLAALISLLTSKVLTIVTFGMLAVFHSSSALPRVDSLGSISFFIAFVLSQKYKKSATQAFAQVSIFLLLVTAFSVYIIISKEIIIGTVFALRSDYRVILLKL